MDSKHRRQKNDVNKNCKTTLESDKYWVSLSF